MKQLSLLLVFLFSSLGVYSQKDLENLIEDLSDLTGIDVVFATSTFKSTRIMNGHSVEAMAPGDLDFRISHRFGKINSGAYEFFGLDQANIHLSLEYGIAKWLMMGLGRGTYEKTFDGFAKFTLARQSSGTKNFPLSISLFSSAAYRTIKEGESQDEYTFSERMSYTGQILAARKINQNLSLQVMPSVVYRNVDGTEPDLLWSAGAGGSVKLTRRINLNAEYYYCFDKGTYNNSEVYNPLSIGFDINTRGHVFQLIFTNSLAMIEKGFIGETTGSWGKGDIHFGFNISRVFTLKN
jgi:hypothetical protein